MLSRHSRARRGSAALIVSAALAAFALATGGSPARAAAADPYASLTGSTQITSDALAGLSSATLVGPVDPTQTISIGVSLNRPDPAGENAYLADVYNPQSPNFRHFLDAAGWQAEFGVPQSRFDALVAWLNQGGLATTPVSGSTEYVLAQGTAAAVESLLQVQINDYTFHGTSFFANTTGPTAPADLGVLAVSGLQNLVYPRPMKQIHDAAIAAGVEPEGPADPNIPGPNTNLGATSPQDLWSIYDQPSTDMGQGESMAIFGDGCTEPSDNAACSGVDLIGNLRNDEATYGLPQMPIHITHYGTSSELSNITDTSGTGEFELDLPASTGMAPLADFEHLYFGANGGDPDQIAAFVGWNQDPNAPRQGSWSYAGCEATPFTGTLPGGPGNPPQGPGGEIIGNPNQDGYEAVLKEAVGLGHTLFNSAGDLGVNGCPSNANTAVNGVTPAGTPINNYPSSSTYVTTVGGTVLYWNGSCPTGLGSCTAATRALEYSWNYSGGGTSLYISAPPWQQATSFATQLQSAPGLNYPCTTNWEAPSAGPPVEPAPYPAGTFCRGLPDVAAQSGDVLTNGYFAGGGTSLSSPLWLGMWTRIQAASSNPGRLGFAAAAIYANNANVSNYERDFFDIGGTSPIYNPGTTNLDTAPECSANPGIAKNNCSFSGWDFISGWGTPDVTNLMKDLDNGNTSPVAFVPASSTPEAPTTALLALSGLGMLAGLALFRRRRAAAEKSES